MDTTTKPDPDDDEADQQARDEALIDRHLSALIEHFDAVQIFATRPCKTDGYAVVSRGRGNWFTRRGMVENWRDRERQNP